MRFEDGRLRHNTVYNNGPAFARQVGLLPREGSTADRGLTGAFSVRTDVLNRLRRT